MDETPAPVLDPGRGKTKKGYFWALAHDDRAWNGPKPPGVAFTYASGRSGKYLTGVLTAIVNGHKQKAINQLLPWNFKN